MTSLESDVRPVARRSAVAAAGTRRCRDDLRWPDGQSFGGLRRTTAPVGPASSRLWSAGADRPTAHERDVGSSGSLCRDRPALIASTRAWWSFSFWSAYSSQNVTSARSKASPPPRLAAIAMRSPERAWARARVAPQRRAKKALTSAHGRAVTRRDAPCVPAVPLACCLPPAPAPAAARPAAVALACRSPPAAARTQWGRLPAGSPHTSVPPLLQGIPITAAAADRAASAARAPCRRSECACCCGQQAVGETARSSPAPQGPRLTRRRRRRLHPSLSRPPASSDRSTALVVVLRLRREEEIAHVMDHHAPLSGSVKV